jgi:hypothetical protein
MHPWLNSNWIHFNCMLHPWLNSIWIHVETSTVEMHPWLNSNWNANQCVLKQTNWMILMTNNNIEPQAYT